jgi:hypothetical protein
LAKLTTQADAKETALRQAAFVSRKITLRNSEKPSKKAVLQLEIRCHYPAELRLAALHSTATS